MDCRLNLSSWGARVGQAMLIASLVVSTGCNSNRDRSADAKPAPKPVYKQPAKAAAPVKKMSGLSLAYPTGDPKTSALTIEKILPGSVQVGQEFTYEIKVDNLTNGPLDGVTVTDPMPTNFKVASTKPEYDAISGGVATWNLDTIPANGSTSIFVTGSATETGAIRQCASVSYVPKLCSVIPVVQPALQLVVDGPDQVMLCDTIPVKFTVTNTGSGLARNVVITEKLPANLKTEAGSDSITVNAGDIAAGKSKVANVILKASSKGAYVYNGNAAGDGGLKADAKDDKTVVLEPVLTVKATGPEKTFIGRDFCHEFTVTNTGDGVSANTRLETTVPAGAKLTDAKASASVRNGKVAWNIGTLEPGASKKVQVCYSTDAGGSFSTIGTVTGKCAKAAQASSKTAVVGIPAILIEVVDVLDPIEVGDDVEYIITVTNQGSANGTNIAIKCSMEDTMQHVSSGGATSSTVAGKGITFGALKSLAPKAKATWRVKVKAVKAGDVRFKVSMTSDQLNRPVEETESTNFYE